MDFQKLYQLAEDAVPTVYDTAVPTFAKVSNIHVS